jgi:hypothetical protein
MPHSPTCPLGLLVRLDGLGNLGIRPPACDLQRLLGQVIFLARIDGPSPETVGGSASDAGDTQVGGVPERGLPTGPPHGTMARRCV